MRTVVASLALLLGTAPSSQAAARNGLIAFQRQLPAGDAIVAISPTGGAVTTLVVRGDSPAWSPDGRRLAYQAEVKRANGAVDIDLFIANGDGTDPRQIDRPGTDDFMPTWSPDGKRLAFTRDDPSGGDNIGVHSEICVVNRDGMGFRRLTSNLVRDFSPAWSPTGSWIAWDRAPGFGGDIWVMRPDGTHKHKLVGTDGWDNAPSWSPDGKAVAFETDQGRWAGVDVVSLKSRRLRHLEGTALDDGLPAWSPDGRTIAFTRVTEQGNDIYLADAKGGNLRLLAADGLAPAWQPLR